MSAQFIPHGHCYLWKPSLVWLQLSADLLIACAYYSIPITLVYFVRKRSDLPYPSIFLLFGAFIVSCGTTHIMEIITLWYPIYWISGVIKAITALVSLYTATEMFFVIPLALKIPSPDLLKATNKKLEEEIEERQRVEKKLRQSEALYRAILEDQTELICRFQADGRLTYVNQAFCRYFGKEPEELVERVYQPLVVYKDREKVKQSLDSLTKETPIKTVENRVNINGNIRWTQWNNRALFDEEGDLIEYQSVGRDISERKLTEQALQESEENFRLAFEDAAIGMALVALNGVFIKVNRSLCEMLGYSKTELCEKKLQAVTYADDLKTDYYYVRQLIKREIRTYQLEKRYLHKQGHIVWISFSASLVRSSQNKPLHFIVQLEDITRRKETEKITKSLQEKEVLLKEIHHRVKNNLQVICSLLNLQARSLKEPKIIEPFKDTQNRVKSMALVHEQLYQSQSLAQISFKDYLKQLTSNLFRSYFASNITLKTNINDFSIDLDTAVPSGLIVNELVANSIKYAFSEQETGEISITAYPEAESFILVVEDNGKGFPPNFDWRESRSLGLSLIRNLTEQLQGRIELLSNLKVGTRFKVILKGRVT